MQAQGGLLVVPFSRERGTSLPGDQSFPWKKYPQKLSSRIKWKWKRNSCIAPEGSVAPKEAKGVNQDYI